MANAYNAYNLEVASRELRLTIIEMLHRAGSGHGGGSLSAIDLINVLYARFMHVDPRDPHSPTRDRFILSKGHAAPALYAVLAKNGFFEESTLYTLRQLCSPLQGHPCMFKLPGVDISTGSLGMGVSVGIGMALSARLSKLPYRVYVLCGDGEMQEGQNWEAFMAAVKWNLENLTVIIDRNRVQLDGTEPEIMPIGDLQKKLQAFGWETLVIDGHDFHEIIGAYESVQHAVKPTAIIANTVKGKGVSYMEGQAAWHGKPLSDMDYQIALSDLRGVSL